MIVELFLITELLKQTVGTPNSTSKAPSPSFGESLTAYPEGWDAQKIVVNVTPEQVAIYKESERVKKQLRGL
jgi:hypothetical protein